MLSQAEIDALLGAVDSGQVAPVETTEATPGHGAHGGRPARTYDFRRPDKFSKDQLRTLQAVHENEARLTAGRLQARLRMPVAMQLVDAEQMVFDEYLETLQLPTQLVVLANQAMGGPYLLNLDITLAYAIVDRLLGGPGRMPSERREPTAIEAELIGRAITEFVAPIDEAWAHLERLNTRVTETALGPSLLRVAAPTTVVAVMTFEIRLAGQSAPVSMCYPHGTLEPLLPRLSATRWYAQPGQESMSAVYREDLALSLQEVYIPIKALIGTVELPVEAVASLEPGDVIRVDERAGHPISVTIADGVGAWAMPGRIGDRLALQLVSQLRSLED